MRKPYNFSKQFRFPVPTGNNAAIVGGMVGMPGVLVGVQRTESLTSSVQNNAALSVRDDNIDEISDRETLENADSSEETAPNTANTGSFDSAERQHLEGSDKGSSSFEIVNAEEARSPEHGNDEFPPIREWITKKVTRQMTERIKHLMMLLIVYKTRETVSR